MVIGNIKGYDFCNNISKKKLEKEGFLSELILKNPNIKDELLDAISNKGYTVGLQKNKVLKIVYIFEQKDNALILKNKIITDNIEEKTKSDFEKIVLEDLKSIASGYKQIDYDNLEITSKQKNGFSFVTFALCLAFSMLIFDNLVLGIFWGFLFAIIFNEEVIVKDKNSINDNEIKEDENKTE